MLLQLSARAVSMASSIVIQTVKANVILSKRSSVVSQRTVWRMVLARRALVPTAEHVVDHARSLVAGTSLVVVHLPKVEAIMVSEILRLEEHLLPRARLYMIG